VFGYASREREDRRIVTCPSCGKELPGEFPFCPFCAAPLATPAAAAATRERKVVSVLFSDLVGFTAASESADPEEVQARVRRRSDGRVRRARGPRGRCGWRVADCDAVLGDVTRLSS
jgi:hypothetical protein